MLQCCPRILKPAQCGLRRFWPYLFLEKLTMRDLYASHAAALRGALRHSVERGGTSSLGVLHQGMPSPSTLTGTDATAQAARIRRQLDRLAPLPRALLVIASPQAHRL